MEVEDQQRASQTPPGTPVQIQGQPAGDHLPVENLVENLVENQINNNMENQINNNVDNQMNINNNIGNLEQIAAQNIGINNGNNIGQNVDIPAQIHQQRVDNTVDENTKLLLKHIKPFNGTSEDLQQWIANWNLIMPLAGLTVNKQIVHFAAKLIGPALEWYSRLPKTQANNIPWTPEALIQAINIQFAHPNALYHDFMKFKAMAQNNNTVDTYAAEFQEMLY